LKLAVFAVKNKLRETGKENVKRGKKTFYWTELFALVERYTNCCTLYSPDTVSSYLAISLMTPYKDNGGNLLFSSSDCEEDMMDDSSSVGTASLSHRESMGHCTPRSRLFDEPTDSQRLSPPRRRTLKPLDINDTTAAEAKLFPDTATRSAADSSVPQHGRKRSSLERRGEERANTGTPNSNTYNNNRLDSSTDSDQTMHTSPHISPASFLTMDGRFVQSKNPFSSPMVTESNAAADAFVSAQARSTAPSFPVSFGSSESLTGSNHGHGTNNCKMASILPPRHHRMQHKSRCPQDSSPGDVAAGAPPWGPATSALLNNGGYPNTSYTFTGSPIQEATDDHPAMETEAASAGSLQKVRRLTETDDVFSATGQHLTNRRKQRQEQFRLSVDTQSSLSSISDGNIMEDVNDDDDEDVSPTDVMGFFQAPPTPVKARPTASPYQPVRRHDPTTPAAKEHRRYAARTPHPGGVLHHHQQQHHLSSGNNTKSNNKSPKSRFYSDFDVIGELGKGSFGTVYKVLSRLDGCMYAIKAAQRKAKGVADLDRMLKEVHACFDCFARLLFAPVIVTHSAPSFFSLQVYALAALSDQADTATFHIVRYHQAWMEDDRLYIQTELCTGTLADEIAKQPDNILPEIRRYKLLREISLALAFINRHNMVHLDIKPDNIFLKNDQFKLGDFGLVATTRYDKDVEEGDSRYMSMELLSGDHNDLTKSDIFSLGATMYEICLGRPLPMSGQEWQDIRSGTLQHMPNTSPDMALIISQMMHPQAASRPTSTELLQRKQLLSEEQKRLMAEMTKVKQANMELQAQQQRFNQLAPPARKGLQRANTWNGSSLPYM